MAKEETLAKIEDEIARGKLGIAKDRLHGLILAYPDDLSLRTRLGDVYFALGYPRMAGRFWFLDNNPTEEKLAAIELFMEECGRDQAVIQKRLRCKGSPIEWPAHATREQIRVLLQDRVPDPPPSKAGNSSRLWEAVWGFVTLFVLCATLRLIAEIVMWLIRSWPF